MEYWTNVLKDLALIMALYLVTAWQGFTPSVGVWISILVAGIIYGVMQGRRAIRFYVKHHHHTQLTVEEFDRWLISHGIDPKEQAARERNKSH